MRLPFSVYCIFFFFAAVSTVGAAPKTAWSDNWSDKMRNLETALNRVLVDISSDARFEDRKNNKEIESDVKYFASLAEAIRSKSAAPPDQDLSIQLIGTDFAEEAANAAKAFSAGHRSYARVMLSSMTNYCIACHTRSGSGPQFSGTKLDPSLDKLSPFAKGNYFAATRNFDRALVEYGKLTADPSLSLDEPFEYARAVRGGLSIAVRVKKDPDLSLRLVDELIANKKAPFYLKEQAAEWKKSIIEWKAEKPVVLDDAAKLFGEANRLVQKARESQKFPADRAADILYLRASGVVHDLLGKAPTGLMASNALYLAGLSYDVLDDYGIKGASGFYFRACIRSSPHTEVAKDCYRRYEEGVYFGYTGSGGTYIPSEVRAQLDELERVSLPMPAAKPEPRRLE